MMQARVAETAEARRRAIADFETAVVEAVQSGCEIKQVAEAAGVTRPTVYAILRRHN